MTDSKPKDGGQPVTSVANGAADSFQAAQNRLLLRRQQREQAESARLALQTSESTLRNRISQTQSPLLRRLGSSTLSLWDTISSREGTRPSFRVGQVDAELLDQELIDLLKTQVGDALKYFSSTGVPGQQTNSSSIKDEWDAEILLVLRAVLFKLTVWDHDATYGAALQNLKYTDARKSGAVLIPPSKWQKSLYGLVTVGGRYVWTKWEDWLLDHNNNYSDPLFDEEEEVSSARVQRLSRITSTLSTVHAAAGFVSFLVFLLHGRYRTLLDRILRMRLAPPTSQVSREVSFEYLNRQLVWHAFTEFLLFVLPLIGINRWRRWLARTWKKTRGIFAASTAGANAEEGEQEEKKGELAFLPERTCAICYADQNSATTENEVLAAGGAGQAAKGTVGSAQTDVTNPYEGMPCGCVYCFVCLATRIEREEGEGWVCLRCGELVKECKPWGGDVLPPVGKSPGLKTVVFADDVVGGLAESDAGEEAEAHQEEEEGEVEERQVEDEEEVVEGSVADGSGSDYHTDTGSNSGSDAGYEMDEDEVGEDMD